MVCESKLSQEAYESMQHQLSEQDLAPEDGYAPIVNEQKKIIQRQKHDTYQPDAYSFHSNNPEPVYTDDPLTATFIQVQNNSMCSI